MAAQINWTDNGPADTLRWRTADVTLDASYPTGGYSITPANLGFTKVKAVIIQSHTGGYVYEYDVANQKLKAYRQTAATGALAEVPNTTSLTGIVVHLFVIGDIAA